MGKFLQFNKEELDKILNNLVGKGSDVVNDWQYKFFKKKETETETDETDVLDKIHSMGASVLGHFIGKLKDTDEIDEFAKHVEERTKNTIANAQAFEKKLLDLLDKRKQELEEQRVKKAMEIIEEANKNGIDLKALVERIEKENEAEEA